MPTVAVINGPNLNRLGRREPEIYGTATLEDVVGLVRARASELGWSVTAFQSNHEGDLIDEIQRQADQGAAGLILNAGALTHYSYALHDAVSSVSVPTVEVHISDISAREEWRRHSVITAACVAIITGHGVNGYVEALDLLRDRVKVTPEPGLRVIG
jgi:3-dehydroquinate dehydratase II